MAYSDAAAVDGAAEEARSNAVTCARQFIALTAAVPRPARPGHRLATCVNETIARMDSPKPAPAGFREVTVRRPDCRFPAP